MKFTTKQLLVLWALAKPSIITASPLPEPGISSIINNVECLVVDIVVKALRAYPSASPFCSSFIHIPTITQSKTVTVTSPTTAVLPTITGTNTITPVVTNTVTNTVTVSTCGPPADPVKRNYAPPPPPPPPSPPRLPSCVANYQSSAISKACSCLAIPTPTTTLTNTVNLVPTITSYNPVAATETADASTTVVTVTATKSVAYCPAPARCDNQGLQWGYLPNTSGPNADATYSNFVPEQYKGLIPSTSHVANIIGGITASGGIFQSLYGSVETLYTSNFILNHRGYIYAQQTGTYTFTLAGVDDAIYVWVGSLAYSGWLGSNANIRVTYDLARGRVGSGSFTIDLSAGHYYPVRVIFAQGSGPAIFKLTVAAPDGTTFLSGSTAGSPYLVQYSCDGTTAPAYPVWSAET